jgi:raffinose/stachyose/melibiose transport system substrate-binding protein
MRKKNGKVLVSLMILFTMLVSACSSPSVSNNSTSSTALPTPASTEANKQKEQSLTLLIPDFANDVEKNIWTKVMSKFKELHPEITTKLTNGNVQVESGKLTTMLQSGVTPPDVILMNSGPARIKVLSDTKLIDQLNGLYTKNNWQDKLRPSAYSDIKSDKIFELPQSTNAIQVYYNKDLFDKAGVKVPTTKEEWLANLKKLKDAGMEPITVGAKNGYSIGWLFSMILESASGREAVDKLLYGDGKWNDPEIVKAAETLADWVKQGYIAKDSISRTAADSTFAFLSKKSAMIGQSEPVISDIINQKVEDSVAAFTMPSLIDGKTTAPTGGVGFSWVIPTKAENKGAAEVWLNFILSEDYSKVLFDDHANNQLLTSKASMSIKPNNVNMDQSLKSIANGSGYNPSVYIGVSAKDAYYQNLQGLVAGLITPKQAMDNIQAGAEKDRAAGFKLTK